MKKLLLTILFTLVLSGGAFSLDKPTYTQAQLDAYFSEMENTYNNYVNNNSSFNCFLARASNLYSASWAAYCHKNIDKAKKKAVKECNKLTHKKDCVITREGKNIIFKMSEKISTDGTKKQKNENMMFTINDKREQCEAIGFKPETEKFADCVLRLVELDIKKQQQTQVTVAQNNGNDALVEQLERQNDIQSSQALINLGQQLMNPKQNNSNIYMPQTQRCTVSGFGATSVVRCY